MITAKAVTDSGLFHVHPIDDKLFFEIPDSILERRWQRNGTKVLLRIVSHENVADDSLPVYQAVQKPNFEAIVRPVDIAALNGDSTTTVIDVTDLFTEDVPILGLNRGMRNRRATRWVGPSYIVLLTSYCLMQ